MCSYLMWWMTWSKTYRGFLCTDSRAKCRCHRYLRTRVDLNGRQHGGRNVSLARSRRRPVRCCHVLAAMLPPSVAFDTIPSGQDEDVEGASAYIVDLHVLEPLHLNERSSNQELSVCMYEVAAELKIATLELPESGSYTSLKVKRESHDHIRLSKRTYKS